MLCRIATNDLFPGTHSEKVPTCTRKKRREYVLKENVSRALVIVGSRFLFVAVCILYTNLFIVSIAATAHMTVEWVFNNNYTKAKKKQRKRQSAKHKYAWILLLYMPMLELPSTHAYVESAHAPRNLRIM